MNDVKDIIRIPGAATDQAANRDPFTGAPGAHPVGTGLGAASAGAAGAMVGTLVAGPVGTVVGAVVGAVAGGLAGSAAGEAANPTEEDKFWSLQYRAEPYYDPNLAYDAFAAAYRTGYEGYLHFGNRSYAEVERDLEARYTSGKGKSPLTWTQARPATRAAWERMHSAASSGSPASSG